VKEKKGRLELYAFSIELMKKDNDSMIRLLEFPKEKKGIFSLE